MTETTRADVLIVGSGIMGAAATALLRESDPRTRIVMVDGGVAIGRAPGVHLHDVADPELWSKYNQRVASGIQGLYTGAEVIADVARDARQLEPGMVHSSAFGEDAAAMPASAIAWNAGGMGVHWTAATPWPGADETFDYGDPEAWQADLETARRLLNVSPSPIGPTRAGEIVLDTLCGLFAGRVSADRGPQPMPMAVVPTASGLRPRTSPSTIFPAMAAGFELAGGEPGAGDAAQLDPAFTLLLGTMATGILIDTDGTRVLGARVRRIADGAVTDLHADIVLVCADTVRTPQLLFASGIRSPALGRYLNEHAFITGRVLMDLERFGVTTEELPLPREGEFCTDSLWIPQNGSVQPFHGQIMNSTYVDEEGTPIAYSVGLSLYTPVESRPENRLVFSDTETDLVGMPKVTFEFAYSERDRALIDRALDEVETIAEAFGSFDPASERMLLPPGSSLHLTGTVRSGTADDGTCVCDPSGRVWGYDNLYVAGNGVIPTAIVANSTLTGTVTAVRAARSIIRQLAPQLADRTTESPERTL